MATYRRCNSAIIILVTCLLASNASLRSQPLGNPLNTDDELFATYLVNSRLYADAILLIGRKNIEASSNPNLFRYLKGWSHYYLKQLDSAAITLGSVGECSPVYLKSRFYSAYCWAHHGDLESAIAITQSLADTTPIMNELRVTQLAGYNLLGRDLEGFTSNASHFTGNHYQFAENQMILNDLHDEIAGFKSKSPLAAGLLSAVVPGLGKVYAQRYGSGLSSFLTVAILGAITWENYRKDGLTSTRTIAFGSLFTLAYSANIYGSVFSVKAYRDDFNQKMDHRILFHLHIPLRNVFN